MRSVSRRDFLKTTCAAGSGLAFANLMGDFAARAAATGGYKALVCLFFRGGMDGHDTVIPYDVNAHGQYAQARAPLMSRYAAASSRNRGSLLELLPANSADFGGRAFALPPDLSGLHNLFQSGRAAIVGNVGPLYEPMNRTQYRDGSRRRPPKLYSHNDQQSTWMSLNTEGEQYGWGGRFADAALASSANVRPVFTAISVAGNDVFLSGERAIQYQVSSGGTLAIREMEERYLLGRAQNSSVAQGLIDAHFQSENESRTSLFERDVIDINRRAIEANAIYDDAVETAAPLSTAFPETNVGGQLRRIAATINIRNQLGANRQVYFAAMGGYDTHSNQANSLPALQRQYGDAIAAFQAAMEEMGVANDVTLFTASDFGRTFVVNGDGTDHGWGAHHFVVGGAVNGGRIFGDIPPPSVSHDQDAGNGRLIPTLSVEQLAAPLGRWFGLNDAELAAALPRLAAFAPPPAFI